MNIERYRIELGENGGGYFSSAITLLRFPLAIFILLLHSSFEHELKDGVSIFEGCSAPLYHLVDFVFVQNICNIAVPLFFLISGFLFFFRDNVFGITTYKRKIWKRFHSLFVPYIIWNILILLLYVIVQNVAPSMNTGRNKMIADYTLHDYLMSFWSMSFINEGGVSGPIDSPLWFIRDLMVMSVFSPVVYWITKKAGDFWIAVVLGLYVAGFSLGIQGFSMAAITFFSLGAYFGIRKMDFAMMFHNVLKITLPAYFLVLLILIYMRESEEYPMWLSRLDILIGVTVVIGIAAHLSNKGIKIGAFLTGSTFFIFASHSEILKIAIRLSSRLGVQSDMYYCVAYFLCPFVTLLLLLMVYHVLSKYTPKLSSILSGGR